MPERVDGFQMNWAEVIIIKEEIDLWQSYL